MLQACRSRYGWYVIGRTSFQPLKKKKKKHGPYISDLTLLNDTFKIAVERPSIVVFTRLESTKHDDWQMSYSLMSVNPRGVFHKYSYSNLTKFKLDLKIMESHL